MTTSRSPRWWSRRTPRYLSYVGGHQASAFSASWFLVKEHTRAGVLWAARDLEAIAVGERQARARRERLRLGARIARELTTVEPRRHQGAAHEIVEAAGLADRVADRILCVESLGVYASLVFSAALREHARGALVLLPAEIGTDHGGRWFRRGARAPSSRATGGVRR